MSRLKARCFHTDSAHRPAVWTRLHGAAAGAPKLGWCPKAGLVSQEALLSPAGRCAPVGWDLPGLWPDTHTAWTPSRHVSGSRAEQKMGPGPDRAWDTLSAPPFPLCSQEASWPPSLDPGGGQRGACQGATDVPASAMLSDTRPPPRGPLPRHHWWRGELAVSSVATDARQVSGTEEG